MTINVTPIPSLTVLAAPAFTLGTSNVAGDAITAVASNSTILAYNTTSPVAIAGTAVVGTSAQAARQDHVHVGGTVVASPKAWASLNGDASLKSGSFNVASTSDDGPGDFNIAWTVSFADVNYVLASNAEDASVFGSVQTGTMATGSIDMRMFNTAGNAADCAVMVIVCGAQ